MCDMTREMIFNLEKLISEICEAAKKEQVSYYLQSQIDRALDMIDNIHINIEDQEDFDDCYKILPW